MGAAAPTRTYNAARQPEEDTMEIVQPRQYFCVCGHTTTWHRDGWVRCKADQCDCRRFKYGGVTSDDRGPDSPEEQS